jgi:hypothetical protein
MRQRGILLVEDNPYNEALILRVLSRGGIVNRPPAGA